MLDVPDGLLRIIYVSTAKDHFSSGSLAELLRLAQQNNASMDISGVLTFHDRAFLQVLEGPTGAVEGIFKRIEADRRHHHIILLERAPISARAFARWAMGWVEHANLLRTGFDLGTVDPHAPSAGMIRDMLLSFERAVGA
jgi:hypothetical protein